MCVLDGYLPSLLSTLLMEKQLKQWNTQHSRLRVCQLTGSKERNLQSYHVSKRSKRLPSFAKKSTGSGQCCYYTARLSSKDLLDRVENTQWPGRSTLSPDFKDLTIVDSKWFQRHAQTCKFSAVTITPPKPHLQKILSSVSRQRSLSSLLGRKFSYSLFIYFYIEHLHKHA